MWTIEPDAERLREVARRRGVDATVDQVSHEELTLIPERVTGVRALGEAVLRFDRELPEAYSWPAEGHRRR